MYRRHFLQQETTHDRVEWRLLIGKKAVPSVSGSKRTSCQSSSGSKHRLHCGGPARRGSIGLRRWDTFACIYDSWGSLGLSFMLSSVSDFPSPYVTTGMFLSWNACMSWYRPNITFREALISSRLGPRLPMATPAQPSESSPVRTNLLTQ